MGNDYQLCRFGYRLVYFGSAEITFGGTDRALFLVDIYCLLFVEKEKIKVAEFGDFHYLFIL